MTAIPPTPKPKCSVRSGDPLESLLSDMDAQKSWQRQRAMSEARLLPPEQLLRLAEMEQASFWKRLKKGSGIAFGALGMLSLVALRQPDLLQSSEILGLIGFTSMSMAIWLTWYVPMRAHKSMEMVITGLEDPRFVGAALTMLMPDSMTAESRSRGEAFVAKRNVLRTLERMLPNLRADHRDLLDKRQMRALYALLDFSAKRDHLLTLSILKGLQQIGDEEAIPPVKRLTKSRNPLVNQAAHECLEYLALRADQKRQEQTLLRASDADAALSPDVLLRPATGDTTPSEQLLRSQA